MKPPRYRTTEHAYGYEVMLLLADGRYVIYRRIGYHIHVVSLPGRIGSLGPQVCEALSGSGECLSAGGGSGSLARVIRRHARKCFARGNEPAYLIRIQAGQDR